MLAGVRPDSIRLLVPLGHPRLAQAVEYDGWVFAVSVRPDWAIELIEPRAA
jgi:hypothetical protein